MKPFTVEVETKVIDATQAPDIAAATVVPVPDYPIDPSTGIPVSRIMGGESPENNIGDTTLPKATVVTNPGQNRGE